MGAADAIVAVTIGDSGDRTAELTQAKEAAAGAILRFRLKPVAAGTDEDGEPVTVCLVDEIDAIESSPKPTGCKVSGSAPWTSWSTKLPHTGSRFQPARLPE
jgi:hypothetical protein